MAKRKVKPGKAALQLVEFFLRNGYIRRQNPERRATEGSARYKKGDEIRFTAGSMRELQLIRKLLRQEGFEPGRPFRKGRQYRLPVYGREAVQRFVGLVRAAGKRVPRRR